MDGASKFVRGDAIAGILVLVINILGGLAILEAMASGKGSDARKKGEQHVLSGRQRLLESLQD